MNSDNEKYFQGFREWLITNEGTPVESSNAIVSNLRAIEKALDDEYVKGQKVMPLHECYKCLSDALLFNKRVRDSNIQTVKKTLGDAF